MRKTDDLDTCKPCRTHGRSEECVNSEQDVFEGGGHAPSIYEPMGPFPPNRPTTRQRRRRRWRRRRPGFPRDVGQFRAAVSWADPDERGVREHHVMWTDGFEEVNFYAVRDPEALVGVARQWGVRELAGGQTSALGG